MAILIEGNDMHDADVGISLPSDADVIIRVNKFRDVGTAIDIYDPKAAQLLGVPAEVPAGQVAELITLLKQQPNATDQEIASTVASSGVSKWLGNADLLLKVTTGCIALVRTGFELFK